MVVADGSGRWQWLAMADGDSWWQPVTINDEGSSRRQPVAVGNGGWWWQAINKVIGKKKRLVQSENKLMRKDKIEGQNIGKK